MSKHNRHGFTIVELIVVIIVIALLATVSAVAYRTTQATARNEKRKADVMMLRSAIDEYYAIFGSYPSPDCPFPADPGTSVKECWRNQAWQILLDNDLIRNIPTPDQPSNFALNNIAGSGNANYGWIHVPATNSYGIYVPMEGSDCKAGVRMGETWWSTGELMPSGETFGECDF